jgi:hypothetical protein
VNSKVICIFKTHKKYVELIKYTFFTNSGVQIKIRKIEVGSGAFKREKAGLR